MFCCPWLPGSSFLQTGPRGEARTAIWLQSWVRLDVFRYAVWVYVKVALHQDPCVQLTMFVWWANSQFTCASGGRLVENFDVCRQGEGSDGHARSCSCNFYRLNRFVQLPGARWMWLLLGCSSHRRLGNACRDGPPKGNWCAIFKSGDGSVREEWGNTCELWILKHLNGCDMLWLLIE